MTSEWEQEIKARDHALRQIGAITLRLFPDLEKQDVAVGSGRKDRTTPLGTLIHDCLSSVINYHARTAVIEKLRADSPEGES